MPIMSVILLPLNCIWFSLPISVTLIEKSLVFTLRWRHIERDGVSNHQPLDCFFDCLFRRKSKKISRLRVTGLCEGNPPVTSVSPHKGSVTWKRFPFDDVVMTPIFCRVQGAPWYATARRWFTWQQWWSHWNQSGKGWLQSATGQTSTYTFVEDL